MESAASLWQGLASLTAVFGHSSREDSKTLSQNKLRSASDCCKKCGSVTTERLT